MVCVVIVAAGFFVFSFLQCFGWEIQTWIQRKSYTVSVKKQALGFTRVSYAIDTSPHGWTVLQVLIGQWQCCRNTSEAHWKCLVSISSPKTFVLYFSCSLNLFVFPRYIVVLPRTCSLLTGSKWLRGMTAQCDGQKWDQMRHPMILDAVKAVLLLRVNVNDVSMVHE